MSLALSTLRRGFSFRFPSPSLSTTFTRTLVNHHAQLPPPPPRDPAIFQEGAGPFARPARPIRTTEDFLKAIGRSLETKVDAALPWEEFWKMDGQSLKNAGVAVRDRRYILMCMEKYRIGFPVEEFAHEPPPKKTIRGWGPKVQNGKRIRSKRIKDKTKRKLPTSLKTTTTTN